MDLKRRIFRKVSRRARRTVRRSCPAGDADGRAATAGDQLRERRLDVGPVAQLVVDRDGRVALVNQQAAHAVRTLGPGDIGRPLQDLEISYRPVELRS